MKFNFLPLALALVVVSGMVGCRRTDVREFEISIPSMTAQNQAKIQNAIVYSDPGKVRDGVDTEHLKFDLARKVVVVRYDSMKIAKKNFELALVEAGFVANGELPDKAVEIAK